jgi:hypothetical protein
MEPPDPAPESLHPLHVRTRAAPSGVEALKSLTTILCSDAAHAMREIGRVHRLFARLTDQFENLEERLGRSSD